MLIFERESWPKHRPVFWWCLVLGLLAAALYGAACAWTRRWLGGSSLIGLTYGVLAAALILFELGYVFLGRNPQTVGRRDAGWSAQGVLRWHVWLGLLVLPPLAILHSGLRPRQGVLAPAVPSLLYGTFLLVVASGVLGLTLQQVLPALLRSAAPAESPYAQIPALRAELADQAWLLVEAAVGDPPAAGAPREPTADRVRELVGRVRRGAGVGPLAYLREWRGDALPPALTQPQADDAPAVWRLFTAVVHPYLARPSRWPLLWPAGPGAPLARESAARKRFDQWQRGHRNEDDTDARAGREVVAGAHPRGADLFVALERLCDRRRQLDRQEVLHRWLHGWLWAHYVLSAALLVLLAWHVLTAVWYW